MLLQIFKKSANIKEVQVYFTKASKKYLSRYYTVVCPFCSDPCLVYLSLFLHIGSVFFV